MKRLLAISLLLFSVSAFAVDSDSDGVDDSNDAFPLDVCASTDTDHDGMPDTLGCFIEGFENQTIQPSWSIQPPWSVQEWASLWDYEAHSGNMAARPSWHTKFTGRLVRQVNIVVPTTLSFYFQTIPSPLYSRFSIDGVKQHLSGNGSTWILFSTTIAAGLHTLEWVGGPCPTFPGGAICIGNGELFALDDISLGVATSLTEDFDDDNDGVLDTWDNYPLGPLQAGDRDGDGIEGVVDNCPTRSNANQLNTDGDAQGDTCDPDDDNDGIADSGDAYPLDPLQAGDIDADGIDGFIDNCPGHSNDQLNTDGDTQGDVCDYDDDNDGVPDIYDRFSLNAAASSDIDYDDFPGSWNAACDITCQTNSGLTLDNCPSTVNANQLDTDGDTQGDACDPDDDNDSIADSGDAYPLDPLQAGDIDADGIDGFVDNCPVNSNVNQLNTDGDSQGNVCDSDDDNDDVLDVSDKFPLNAAASSDTDLDSFPNAWNASCNATCQSSSGLTLDNCPSVSNPSQTNTDGDSAGNICDSTPNGDSDGDDIDNLSDNCRLFSNAAQTDSNGNGFGDACEVNTSGDVKGDLLGSAIAVADMNNDGYGDIIIGSPLADVTIGAVLLKDAGTIKIISGANGSNINTLNGTLAKQQFGSTVAVVADQNTDTVPDLIVGNPFTLNGNVTLYSGADGSFIQSIADGAIKGDKFGAAVAVDENGNLIVGAPLFDVIAPALLKDAGRVYVFSGISNNLLYTRDGALQGEHFGSAVAVNTVDHQLLIGSPGFDVAGITTLKDAGRVQIFDATDLTGSSAALFTQTGSAKGDLFGSTLSSFNQDMNGDTGIDWVVGIPGTDILNNVTNKLMKDTGKLQLFSGLNSSFIKEMDGATAGDNFGAAACAFGDVNSDGDNDLVVGSPKFDPSISQKDAGQVEVISGAGLF